MSYNLSEISFHNVSKVCFNSTTLKITTFVNGVWWCVTGSVVGRMLQLCFTVKLQNCSVDYDTMRRSFKKWVKFHLTHTDIRKNTQHLNRSHRFQEPSDGAALSRSSLNFLQQKLETVMFFRFHRSSLSSHVLHLLFHVCKSSLILSPDLIL